MIKRIITLVLVFIMMLSLVSCASSSQGGSEKTTKTADTSTTTLPEQENPEDEPDPEEADETGTTTSATREDSEQATTGTSSTTKTNTTTTKTNTPVNVEVTMSSFDDALIKYVNGQGMKDKNYMISPLSLRAALCLAIAGADGTTKAELLKACGFANQNEANTWYKHLTKIEKEFKDYASTEKDSDLAFSIVNSVWNNTSFFGDFTKEYKKYVTENYGAEVRGEKANNITNAVNDWCKKKTNGLIPSISDDLSMATAVLVNALYLKSQWAEAFPEGGTKKDTFTGIDGKKKTVLFMEQTKNYSVYQDKDTTIAVLPMKGNKYFVLVIGDTGNLDAKLKKAKSRPAHVKMPKFETAATFKEEYLIGFLKANGVKLAFDASKADFSTMCADDRWYIDEIIQKDKIKVDENGLEAAAVTAIIMKNSASISQEVPVEVIADKPFSYYIYSNLYDSDKELLFYGQYVSAEE